MTLLDNPRSVIGDGIKTVTTAATRVALSTTTTPITEVTITALSTNTGIIVVGGSTVVAAAATRRGTPLAAGDSVGLEVNSLASVWLDATVSGEGVSFTYLAP